MKCKNQQTFASLRLPVALLLGFYLYFGASAWGDDSQWVKTWIASPSTIAPDAAALANPENHYQDQSLRLIVHTSAGGSKIRLRLANTHGETLLTVGAVTVALQANDSGVVAESIRPVTFAGQAGIVVPRGAEVLSDAIDFKVPSMANLSIGLYFPTATPFITRHNNANQRSWLAPGNQLNAAQLREAKTITSWEFIVAAEVQTAGPTKVIATVGDSITDGYLSTVDGNQRWPNYLARRLQAEQPDSNFSVVNAGISGNRVLREASPRFGENLLARLERDVLSIANLSHIILLEGINDIGMGSRVVADKVSAEELIAGYRQVIARAHARGVTVFGATLLPFQGAAYYSAEGEKVRLQVNQWIREGGEYDGVIDFEQATRDPANPARILPGFTQDNLHPNDGGYEAMAKIIDLSLFNH